MNLIPVYDNLFNESDAQAAAQAVRSGILSSFGPEVGKLEKRFAEFIGTKYALSCTSGTTALYLALAALRKDHSPFGGMRKLTVAVPTCSYAATAFSVLHHDSEVVFIDSDIDTWNLNLNHLEQECKTRQHSDNPINVVLAVHNYGNPINMDKLMALSKKYYFLVVEDACEAFTSTYKGKQLGSFGHIGVFSFYGNKLISAGEGGMVVVNDDKYHEYMKLQRGQGQDPNRRFWHLIPGWNFRMTNLQAAVVNSQFDRLDKTCARKREIYNYYHDHLDADLIWQTVPAGGESCWWMVSVRHWEEGWYERAAKHLLAKGIETRPIFPPIHKMPAMGLTSHYNSLYLPNADLLVDTGITLPSGPTLSNDDLAIITKTINEIV